MDTCLKEGPVGQHIKFILVPGITFGFRFILGYFIRANVRPVLNGKELYNIHNFLKHRAYNTNRPISLRYEEKVEINQN